MKQQVIVVGGGLAGLSCAVELARAGVGCRVFEAADGVGGRVRTDVVEGFRLDRIRRALPAMDLPIDGRASARIGPGLDLAGDHAADSSINGAMASGPRAAAAVLEDLAS